MRTEESAQTMEDVVAGTRSKKKKKTAGKTAAKIIIAIVVIIAIVAGILFIVYLTAKAEGLDSVDSVLDRMQSGFDMIWKRLIG